MKKSKIKMRQVVDWNSAFWAGVIAGTIFFLLNIFLVPTIIGGNSWVIIRLLSSIILGESILAPPATYDTAALFTAIIANFWLSIIFGFILAFIIHKWGMMISIVGGAIFGLAIYLINFYSLSYFFPWFFPLSNWTFVLSHVIYGAAAGGIYEWFEVEKFVPVNNSKEK